VRHILSSFFDHVIFLQDSAKLCFLMAWMLLLAGCKPALLAGKALLYWAGVAMRTLVPCMITTSASSPSAGGGGAQFTQAAPEPINHIAGMLVPRFLFCRWLANSGRSGMSYERLKLACEVATDQRERPWERVHSKLWVMEARTARGLLFFIHSPLIFLLYRERRFATAASSPIKCTLHPTSEMPCATG
jgi:hypothetical protein